MVRPAPARRIGEWTGLDPSACCGVSLFRHEILGYEGHGLVRERAPLRVAILIAGTDFGSFK